MHRLKYLLCICLLVVSTSCARTATLLPQADSSYKVVTLGKDLKEARKAARAEAETACRREKGKYEGIAEDPPETMPDGQIRLRWRFRCVERGY
ncbi:MAG: hypothetical protein ACRETN_02970 [Nevskiales bacterium]